MNHPSVRRSAVLPLLLGATAVLAACEDKHLKKLDTGITRDSALTVISHDLPAGATADSFPNVYVRDRYLIGGKSYEILYFTPGNEKALKQSVPFKDLTPLVFVDNKMVGRGWSYWDSVSTANKIPLKNKDSVVTDPNDHRPKKK